MLRYNILYFLLFVLLIMGAFASMAQNSYGQDILGSVAFAFCAIFLIRVLSYLFRGKKTLIIPLEWAALSMLSFVLGLRVYFIWFEGVELVFSAAGLLLIVVYAIKLTKSYQKLSVDNLSFSRVILAFHLSIIFYIASMTVTPFFPLLGEPLGALGFLFIVIFFIANFRLGTFSLTDERVSPVKFIGRYKDGSLIMVSLFLVFTAYMGLTKLDVLPGLYSNQYPEAYYELVRTAESGLEKPTDGEFRHELFKERYESFVSRNGTTKNE